MKLLGFILGIALTFSVSAAVYKGQDGVYWIFTIDDVYYYCFAPEPNAQGIFTTTECWSKAVKYTCDVVDPANGYIENCIPE